MNNLTYLDYNATAPARHEVIDIMVKVMREAGNASASHMAGRHARKYVENAREQVATLIDSSPKNITFNSGATEANNTVLSAFKGKRVLVSAIEHPSILKNAPHSELISVTSDGIIDLSILETLINTKEPPALICVMLVNNKTGVIQPLKNIVRLAKTVGAFVLCDAAQGAGRIALNFEDLEVDFMSLSSHKIAGPHGVGALVIRKGLELPPLLVGGGQENELRAGTLNVAGIAGFGLAAQKAKGELERYQRLSLLRDKMETNIQGQAPEAIIYGQKAPRVPNTSYIGLPGLPADEQLMALDMAKIAVSAGSSCTSGTVQPSHVLQAMGASDEEARCAIRISMGWCTQEDDIDRFLEIWSKIYTRFQKQTLI